MKVYDANGVEKSNSGGGVSNPLTSDLDAGTHKVTNSGAPTVGSDLTTKTYVDTADALAIPKSLLTTKGDVITTTAASTPARHGVPADGSLLIAAAAQADGWTTGDHGAIGGLADDDHTQYLRTDGTRALTGDQSAGSHKITNVAAPTAASNDAANAAYVDTGDALAIAKATLTAKGDLISASAASTPSIVTVGANNRVLMADSSQTAGMRWVTQSTLGLPAYDVSAYRQTGTLTFESWYLGGDGGGGAALTTGAPAIGVMWAMPWVERRGGTLDRIAFNVTTVGAAGSKAMVAIYTSVADPTNLYPSTKLVAGTEFATDAGGGTGIKSTTISQALTQNTLYWFVYYCGTSAPTIRGMNTGNCERRILGFDNTLGAVVGNLGIQVARAYDSTFPTSFPASGTMITAVPIPAIFVRYSS